MVTDSTFPKGQIMIMDQLTHVADIKIDSVKGKGRVTRSRVFQVNMQTSFAKKSEFVRNKGSVKKLLLLCA